MFVIPIEKQNPTRHIPWMVYGLICINVIIFGYTHYFDKETIFSNWGFIPADPSFTTMVTSMFLHGGVLHIVGNMFFFWMFGDNVEDVLGAYAFLFVYLVCGFSATGLHYLFNVDSTIPCIGASGAISGIVGVYFIFFPRVRTDLVFYFFRFRLGVISTTASVAIGVWFVEQTALGLATEYTALKSYVAIAFWAHVGGLVAGIVLGVVFRLLGYMENYEKGSKRNWLFGYVGL